MSEPNPAEHSAPRRGDLTEGPILRTLVAFSIPTMFANLLQTLGGTINTIWVGQLLGEGALAATANGNIVVFLAFTFVFGFSMAATVRVGQYFGARNVDAMRRVFGTGTGLCLAIALGVTLFGWLFARPLVHLLATPEAIVEPSLAYIRVSFLSMPFSTLGMIVSMGMRGVGDARSPFIAMVVQTVLGIALNPLFILGFGPLPAMGIAGSALANVVASMASAVMMIALAYRHDLPLRLRGSEFRYLVPAREELGYVMSKGLPMGAQMLISSSAAVVMIGLVNREGMLTTAAYGAVLQIWNYIQMPSFAVSMAVSAMVAQNVGAGRHDRVGRITMAGVWVTVLITVVLTVAVLALDAPLLALFLGKGSAAITIAERIQLLSTWAWVLGGVAMILIGTLRSYGVVIVPLLIFFVAQYPGRLGFYWLLYPVIGADALWWSYVFGSAVTLLLAWWAYARGDWRRHRDAAMPAVPLSGS